MQFLKEDFDFFVSERMQDNFKKLKKYSEYKKTKKDYDIQYNNFIEKLTYEDREKLEKALDLKYYLFSMEMCLSYKIGLLDGIKLDKSVIQ